MSRIKLCGFSRMADIEAANRLLPEYVGFVFAKQSRRNVTPETAVKLKAALNPRIQAVGVFVDVEKEEIAALTEKGVIDLVQLHGKESEDYIIRLKKRITIPVIKAFRIDTAQDIRLASACSADYVLLDSGTGGTGTAFDWELLLQMHRPYFLAGGLNPDNIRDAMKYEPFAVDVSSGIETDGYKDSEKIAAFVAAVRKAGRQT